MTSRCHDFHQGHSSRASWSPSLTPKSQAGRGGWRGQGHLPVKVQLHSWFCLSPEQRGWATKASPAAADGWALKTRSLGASPALHLSFQAPGFLSFGSPCTVRPYRLQWEAPPRLVPTPTCSPPLKRPLEDELGQHSHRPRGKQSCGEDEGSFPPCLGVSRLRHRQDQLH